MALRAAEARREEGLDDLQRNRVADDEAAEADHVQVVVLDALVRGERFMNEARANARHLICGNASSHSAAANGHTPIHFATRHGTRQTHDKIGIVIVGLQPVVSEVDHRTARVTQPCGEMVLQVKAAVVRGESDPHRAYPTVTRDDPELWPAVGPLRRRSSAGATYL